MHSSLKLAIVCLRISAIIYWLLGTICLFAPLLFIALYTLFNFLPPDLEDLGPAGGLVAATLMSWFAAFWGIAPALFIEFVIQGLKRNQYWAWVSGLIMCGIYVPSGFIVLGVLGLVGLLNQDVIKQFSDARTKSSSA